MKVLISHPTSNQNNRAVVKGLYEAEMLYGFYTTIASFSGTPLDRLSSFGPFKEISRRRFDPELRKNTHAYPLIEGGRLLCSKIGFKKLIKHETGFFSVDKVYHHLDRKVASVLKQTLKNGPNAVYAYEDGAYHSFKSAKERGINCLYDLPIGYWRTARKLLSIEQERWPDWSSTLTGFRDSEIKLKRKDQELELADYIYVASSFTAKSLKDYPGKIAPVEVIPYGFPDPTSSRTYSSIKKPVKLLFVGGLSQRKGIANMFTAVENLKDHVSLTVVGRKSTQDCQALNNALSKHTWISSLSHDKVLELMREHDILLFPSLFEGFGLVITEAMSQGTPVITTDRTAGPDLIQHGHNGWLVEAGSTENLQQCIEDLITTPKKIIEAGKAAMQTAQKRPWKVYGKELAHALHKNHS